MKQYTRWPLLSSIKCHEVSAISQDLPAPVEYHHDPILTSFNCDIVNNTDFVNENRRDFFKTDYNLIISKLHSFDWISLLNDLDIQKNISLFYGVIDKVISDNVPIKRKSDSSHPSWYSYKLMNCLVNKKRLHKRLKLYDALED